MAGTLVLATLAPIVVEGVAITTGVLGRTVARVVVTVGKAYVVGVT